MRKVLYSVMAIAAFAMISLTGPPVAWAFSGAVALEKSDLFEYHPTFIKTLGSITTAGVTGYGPMLANTTALKKRKPVGSMVSNIGKPASVNFAMKGGVSFGTGIEPRS